MQEELKPGLLTALTPTFHF